LYNKVFGFLILNELIIIDIKEIVSLGLYNAFIISSWEKLTIFALPMHFYPLSAFGFYIFGVCYTNIPLIINEKILLQNGAVHA
jgi:hypothetical protein